MIEAGWKGRARRTVSFRRRARVAGRVLGAGGAPVAGAQVVLLDAPHGPAAADRDHRRAGALRAARAGHADAPAHVGVEEGTAQFACSRRLTLRVRAGLTLRARPGAVRNGERVRLSGRLRGGAIPPKGKLVELQALEGGRLAHVRVAAHRPARAVRHPLPVRRTFSPRTFRFRARARAEAGYPFVLGVSRSTTVRVTP